MELTEKVKDDSGPVVDLGDLLRRQRQLMNVLGIQEGPVDNILFSALYKDVLIMLAGEVQEALEPLTLGTKPWKVVDSEQLKAHALEELVDVLFFVLEAFELAGLSAAEIDRRYEDKRKRNLRRAGQTQAIMDAKAAQTKEPIFEIPGSELLSALQRAAGMASSIKTRSVLWQAVWDAEALEAGIRSKTRDRYATVEFILKILHEVNEKFGIADKSIVADCLRDQLGQTATTDLLKKVEWNYGTSEA